MSLKALPDFQYPLQGEGYTLYAPFEGGGYTLIPEGLEVARRADGRPDFVLEAVRGESAMLPPEPHGILDFRLAPDCPFDAGLALARDVDPSAIVQPAAFSAGFLRLRLAGALDVPSDLVAPVELAWNGLGIARCILPLSEQATTLLRGVLTGQLLPLTALAELELVGVAPRLPLAVHFDPAVLLGALATLADDQGRVARAALIQFFAEQNRTSLFRLEGELADEDRLHFAEAMTDRVRARWASLTPAPGPEIVPTFTLTHEMEGSGEFSWDLSQPQETARPFVLALDPLAAARTLVKEQGLDTAFRETRVPALQTGFVPLSVAANLPEKRQGALMLGVTLSAPANPPLRFQAIAETIELIPPVDRAAVVLRFSPVEEPAYSATAFAVVQDSGGVRKLAGAELARKGGQLRLTPDDFPLAFIGVAAERSLLELAGIHGVCRWQGGPAAGQPFELTLAQPSLALAIPKSATGATIEIEARSPDGAVVRLEPRAARALRLGLFSFREYGAHTQAVACAFDDDTRLMAIELAPEDGGAPTTLALTPEQPRKAWSWLARSPFKPGYRYRLRRGADRDFGDWSSIQPFDAPLAFQSSAATPRSSAMFDMPGGFSFEDLYCYPSPNDPAAYFYVPGAPAPQRTAQGDPSLSVLSATQLTILQLSVVWGADEAVLERLRAQIAHAHRDLLPSQIRLSPAPLTVDGVTLRLTDEHSTAQPLATARSSGVAPYNTIFNARLDDTQKTRVLSALGGNKDMLTVAYAATLPQSVSASVTLEGDARPLLAELHPDATSEDAVNLIERAIESSRLTVIAHKDNEASKELLERARAGAIARAADLLLGLRQGADSITEGKLHSSATEHQDIPKQIERVADVAGWFPNGAGMSHVQVVG